MMGQTALQRESEPENKNANRKRQYSSSGKNIQNNGLILRGTYIPEELLILILNYLDNKTLCKSKLVCHKWWQVINNDVWKSKAIRLYPQRFSKLKQRRMFPSLVYQGMCFNDCYGGNLLKNNSGQNNFDNWNIVNNGGDRWIVEKPPIGVQTPPKVSVLEPECCFVTSYGLCKKLQMIDLYAQHIHPDILNTFQPDIVVSECYAARWDCDSMYEIEVALLDTKHKEVKKFMFQERLESWVCGWKEVKHTFSDYGKNVRFVAFQHMGKDARFWAGHYGSKMGNASVTIDLSSIKISTDSEKEISDDL